MRETHKGAKSKLGAVRYAEYLGDMSHEEAQEERAAQIAKIYRTAKLVR